jgi:hypothetical protein
MAKIVLPDFPVEGGCVCGALSYRLIAGPLYVIACHCLPCQCLSGSDYSLSMFVRREDFQLVTGSAKRCARSADSGRMVEGHFCGECGVRVWHEQSHSPQLLNVKAGTLDDPSWAVPVGHIWTMRKKRHVVLEEGTVQVSGQPAVRQVFFDAWADAISLKADAERLDGPAVSQ